MSITTKTGDNGETGLLFSRRTGKDDPRIAACGDVDELNSAIGLAKAHLQNTEFAKKLTTIQQALIALMQEERIGQARAIDNPVLRDRLLALQAEVSAMKCNGMRILSNSLKGESGGMAKLIVKLQSCEIAHQISALAIDAMGEIGTLYHGSPREREGGAWQWN